MYVIKRNGQREAVHFDKITARIEKLMFGLDRRFVEPIEIAKKTIQGIYDNVSTVELDNLAAETAASMVTLHPDYGRLAARIAVSNLHKTTPRTFSECARLLYTYVDPKTGEPAPLLADDVYQVIAQNATALDKAIDYSRDFEFDYFGFKTLERSYLLKLNGKPIECPQHMFMRVAVGIHKTDIAAAIETYDLMSDKWFTHATPTLFNSGTPKPQMSSCFLLMMQEDSIPGIFNTLKQCAEISQSAGGIGLAIHNIRATGSYIRGTNGTSNGIVPMLRMYNDTARYVDQGGGKRKGAFAIYLEPWHSDIFEFLELKKNHGKEEMRARDLFYALWIPDLFMQRVKDGGEWSLFDPNEAPGMHEVWGEAFEALYTRYEAEGRQRRTVKAQELWFAILDAQIESGNPYMLYKDHANRKSNQQNLGTIKSSNLCTEIMEYTDRDEVAVCNLASLALNRYVDQGPDGEPVFNFERLVEITKVVTRNLNKIIDRNYYPIPEAERSNLRHRPIGIGVQGLADAFIKMRMPFDSEAARELNRDIFEAIYFGAMTASAELAEVDGAYSSFEGSPLSKGQFQFDLWNVTPSNRWDWESLRLRVMKTGVRNSLLVAPMPTASTSQILGNNECFEPYTSNIYSRRVLSGEFAVVNKHLMHDLIALGLWNEELKQKIIVNNGSIQAIREIPDALKELYKTVWEIKQRTLIDMAADRGAYICQSQSLNLFIDGASYNKLTSMHFYAWEKGLKTGMYYLRTKPAADAIKFTVDAKATKEDKGSRKPEELPIELDAPVTSMSCSINDPNCLSCSA